MNVNFGPRGMIQIDDARIIFRNFEGRGDKFNREGDRNFSLLIEDPNTADILKEHGWNVKIKEGRDIDEEPFMRLPVKVKYSDYSSPKVYLWTGNRRNILDEESIACLDSIEIDSVNMDLRPYDWEVNGRTGRTAYLQTIEVFQRVDRFEERYANMTEEEKLPF